MFNVCEQKKIKDLTKQKLLESFFSLLCTFAIMTPTFNTYSSSIVLRDLGGFSWLIVCCSIEIQQLYLSGRNEKGANKHACQQSALRKHTIRLYWFEMVSNRLNFKKNSKYYCVSLRYLIGTNLLTDPFQRSRKCKLQSQ